MEDSNPAPMPKLTPQDSIIAVMGITGSGKSTFISRLVGGDDIVIGHTLSSRTTEVRAYSFVHKSARRIFLIDTPGFNDTNRRDTEVLKDVAYFLSGAYKQNIRLSGIIYLHRITDPRMQGSNVKSLSVFKKLCGEDTYKHIVLATTMWGDLPTFSKGVERERQLVDNQDWWGCMNKKGSKIVRHTDDRESALDIVSQIMESSGPVVLQIQREMVDQNKSLDATEAGQEVEEELELTKQRVRANMREIENEHRKAMEAQDQDLAEILQKQLGDWDAHLERATNDQAELKVNLERLQEERESEVRKIVAEIERQERAFQAVRAKQESELERIQTARQKDKEEYHRLQTQHDTEITDIHIRIIEMGEQHEEEAAKVAEEEAARLERHKLEAQRKYVQRQESAARREGQLKQEMQATKKTAGKSKARLMKTLQVLMFLGGLGVTIAGAVTVNPALIVAGVSVMAVPLKRATLGPNAE